MYHPDGEHGPRLHVQVIVNELAVRYSAAWASTDRNTYLIGTLVPGGGDYIYGQSSGIAVPQKAAASVFRKLKRSNGLDERSARRTWPRPRSCDTATAAAAILCVKLWTDEKVALRFNRQIQKVGTCGLIDCAAYVVGWWL